MHQYLWNKKKKKKVIYFLNKALHNINVNKMWKVSSIKKNKLEYKDLCREMQYIK